MELEYDNPPLRVNTILCVRKGFSITELMVVIGVLVVLIGILLPGLGKSRQSVRDLGVMSNIRQLGLLVTVYMAENRAAPAVFPATRVPAGEPHHYVSTPYGGLRGFWFTNSKYFQYVLDERVPNAVVAAPGRPNTETATFIVGDYSLSDALYARPEYWNRMTQRGVAQWATMRIDQVRYPSSKGFMLQDFTYSLPNLPGGMMTCCADDVPSAILWSDLSASREIQGRLKPGAPNFHDERNEGTISYWQDGAPVRSTVDGVHGRDR